MGNCTGIILLSVRFIRVDQLDRSISSLLVSRPCNCLNHSAYSDRDSETHQLANESASTIAWIPGLEVFILMFLVRPRSPPSDKHHSNTNAGPIHWQDLRQLWAATTSGCRPFPPCLRSDDDLARYQVLSVHPCARNLQSAWHCMCILSCRHHNH